MEWIWPGESSPAGNRLRWLRELRLALLLRAIIGLREVGVESVGAGVSADAGVAITEGESAVVIRGGDGAGGSAW